MNDYDIFIKEMIDETIKPDGELSAMARKFYETGYEHCKQQAPKGLPGVNKQQVLEFYNTLIPEGQSDRFALAYALTQWFNDPNRDAPAMHADLEWLASRPVTDFRLNCDSSKVLGFYRIGEAVAAALRPEDGRLWASNNPPVFSLEAIHQARGHLANQKIKDESRQHLRDYVEDVRDQLAHDLVNLPDYETWFEKHGWETVNRDTRMAVIDSDVPTTVHELYTHFRARLLDELRQAGVIGDER